MQVREQGQQKGEASPFLAELLRLEDQAKQEGLGRWSKVCLLFLFFKNFVIKLLLLLHRIKIKCSLDDVLATWFPRK
jgi:hypothetical protein